MNLLNYHVRVLLSTFLAVNLFALLLTFFHCRLDLNEDSVRERERYEAREREEVVRKQRERKAADIKARQQLIKQIADDRK